MPARKKPTKSTKPTAKKASKGKRYTDKQKAEVLAFVEAQGRGGQTAAAKKFGISALTISNWRKKAGGTKATTPRKVSTKAAGTWDRMVALKADIDVMERKLAAKKEEFGKLAKKL